MILFHRLIDLLGALTLAGGTVKIITVIFDTYTKEK